MQNFPRSTVRAICVKYLAGCALAAALLPAQAGIITAGSGLAAYDHLVDFSNPSLDPNTPVTGQYAALGLSFAATAGGAVRANGCGIGAFAMYGLAGDSLHTYGPGCTTNGIDDSFSISFDSAVSAASFTLISYRADGSNSFAALLDGVIVGSFMHDAATDTSPGSSLIASMDNAGISLVFSDMLFDEIRYSEGSSASGGYLMIDNVAWRNAAGPGAGAVSEPASLALFGLGLAGIAFGRRKARA